jgi:hypothetical protein
LPEVRGDLEPGKQAESPKTSHQLRETPAIFLDDGREWQPQSASGLNMPHNGFGPDLTFFDKRMKVGLRAYSP